MATSLHYVHDYRCDAELRRALNALTRDVFGFTFEPWWDAGWWRDEYVCHSLMDGNVMVANASTTRMTLIVEGRRQPAVQVGTVATLPAYRGRGLSRRLMDAIVAEHHQLPMFLFANDSVVDFYPRFGFRPGQAQAMPVWNGTGMSARCEPEGSFPGTEELARVAPSDPRVARCLAGHRFGSGVFDAESDSIRMFHFIAAHPQHLYLSEDGTLLVVAKRTRGQVDVYGIFATRQQDNRRLLASLSPTGVEQVRFHFEPDGFGILVSRIPHHVEDTHLFVNERFPVLNRPWVFPTLAYT